MLLRILAWPYGACSTLISVTLFNSQRLASCFEREIHVIVGLLNPELVKEGDISGKCLFEASLLLKLKTKDSEPHAQEVQVLCQGEGFRNLSGLLLFSPLIFSRVGKSL